MNYVKIKNIITILFALTFVSSIVVQTTIAALDIGKISEKSDLVTSRYVTVYAPAVASTDKGYVGAISTITVKIQNNGSGRVFVETLPLTEVDMQGSARLAVKVASALVKNDKNCKVDPSEFDYFFVVRTDAPIIGGPSAGAIMTVATVALLENWSLDDKTIMTGMINPDGSVGPVGGILQKIDAAASVGATRFLIPKGQGLYTELEGWRLVTKNVSDYARTKYGITVIEVSEINEAIENFTGYRFVFEKSDKEIKTEDYINSTKPLATKLLEKANELYRNASKKFESSSIPDIFPNYYRSSIKEKLDEAKKSLDDSEMWYNKTRYYTSTSKSFQSLICSRFVIYACDYYETNNRNFLSDLLKEVEDLYNKSSQIAKDTEIVDFISLQTVGAAQKRATEAKLYLDNAKGQVLYSFSDVLDFLYDIAFVVERCNSIGWWIDIGENFEKSGEINLSKVDSIAIEYIDEAQQAITYSNLLLSEMGSTSTTSINYLNSAENLLSSARKDIDNSLPAAALFEALEALVKANLAIEIIGMKAEDKINYASEKASNSIARSRELGIEPILAVSYYEYAESLSNESSYESALIYYKYSGMIAGMINLINASVGSSVPEYVGISRVAYTFYGTEYLIIIFSLGILVGLGLGLITGGIVANMEEKKKIPVKYKPRIPWYLEKYKYPGDQIPRSIRDYYKKNK